MSVRKTVSFIICLAILALAAFVLLRMGRHPKTGAMRDDLKDRIGMVYDNLRSSIAPARRPPLSTIELEENLKRNLPVPFVDFNKDDWDGFWRLLYGTYTVDSDEWPKRKRQLTREEIQEALVNRYYQPFGSFSQEQWGIFWQYVLKGRVFK